jgi:hypothetical protein
MIREFESPGFIRTLFLLGLAVVGLLLVYGTIEGAVPVREHILRWLR